MNEPGAAIWACQGCAARSGLIVSSALAPGATVPSERNWVEKRRRPTVAPAPPVRTSRPAAGTVNVSELVAPDGVNAAGRKSMHPPAAVSVPDPAASTLGGAVAVAAPGPGSCRPRVWILSSWESAATLANSGSWVISAGDSGGAPRTDSAANHARALTIPKMNPSET